MTSFDNGGSCPEPSRHAHHFHCINPEVCGITEVISLRGGEGKRKNNFVLSGISFPDNGFIQGDGDKQEDIHRGKGNL